MPVLILAEDFNRSGALQSPWTLKTGDTWTMDGYKVQPAGTSNTFRRCVLQGFNPFTLVSASTTQPTYQYSVEAQVTAPATLSSTQTTYAGLTFLSSGANGANSHMEVAWNRDSGGSNSVRCQRRDSAGTAIAMNLGVASISSVAAGTTHTLACGIAIWSATSAFFTAYWDGVPTLVNVPFSLTGFGFNGTLLTATHYPGLVASVPGPDSGSGPLYPLYFDNFRFRDVGINAVQPATQLTPTLAAVPTLASVPMTGEDDADVSPLPLTPSYVVAVDDGFSAAEHRFDSGHVQTVSRVTQRRRRWHLRWNAISASQRNTLATFEQNRAGRKQGFAFSDPDSGLALEARFATDLVLRQLAPDVFQAEVDVEEIRSA